MHWHTDTTGWARTRRCTPHNNCVEIRFDANSVGVRDSKNVDAVPLKFAFDRWTAFVTGLVR
ncbi:DUF397 domain-containing protein [Actinophytocola sediminis]